MTLEPVLNKFSEYCNPRKNVTILCHKFLIKDMIVSGTNDNAFHERLLRESDLTLSRAISAGHAAEKTQKHAREICSTLLVLLRN